MAATVRRPGSVTLVIVLTWLSALFGIAAGVLLMLAADDPTFTDPLGVSESDVLVAGIITLVLGVLTAMVAAGLGSGSRFARFLVTLVMLLRIAGAAYAVIALGTGALVSAIVTAAFALLILMLLWNARASEFFTR